MASRKTDPTAPAATARYVWPDHPDDPTLGGAITPEMYDALHDPAPAPAPPASSLPEAEETDET